MQVTLALMPHREWNCSNHLGFPRGPNRKGFGCISWAFTSIMDGLIFARYWLLFAVRDILMKHCKKVHFCFKFSLFWFLKGKKVHWFSSISPPILQQTNFGSWNHSCALIVGTRSVQLQDTKASSAAAEQPRFRRSWTKVFLQSNVACL